MTLQKPSIPRFVSNPNWLMSPAIERAVYAPRENPKR